MLLYLYPAAKCFDLYSCFVFACAQKIESIVYLTGFVCVEHRLIVVSMESISRDDVEIQ